MPITVSGGGLGGGLGFGTDPASVVKTDLVNFVVSDWQIDGTNYTITYPYTVLDNVGTPLLVQESTGCEVGVEINNANQEIKITVNRYPDNRFAGTLIIIGN